MTSSDRERREAEKAARRARRLAERAEQRAQRKGEQAKLASDRVEQLAERARRRVRPSDRNLGVGIEDLVDDVAEKWSRKASEWINRQSDEPLDEPLDETLTQAETDRYTRRSRRRKRASGAFRDSLRRSRHGLKRRYGLKRRHGLGLYRDTKNKKICGVCAGCAEYFGFETWQVRAGAGLALFFLPTVAIPTYFITYFLMDKKPYYREAAERYDEDHESEGTTSSMRQRKSDYRANKSTTSNVQALKQAKQKFANIEDRLRGMESHVTSSQFELKREFKKISGEES